MKNLGGEKISVPKEIERSPVLSELDKPIGAWAKG
jgi:hypothetical protein